MKDKRTSKYLAAALILSLLPVAKAQQPQIPADLLQTASSLLNANLSQKKQKKIEAHSIGYLSAILGVNPQQVAETKQVDPATIQDLSQLETTKEEQDALDSWARMYDEGTLKANIEKLVATLKASPGELGDTLRALPPEKQAYAVNALTNSVEAVIKMRGLTGDTQYNTYREWTKLSEKMLKQVDKSQSKQRDILDMANSSWIRTEAVEVLVNGPASFAKRDQLLQNATQSINIMTWSIYDDVTGKQLVDTLLAKKQQNPYLPVRVIIDGQIGQTPGHNSEVSRLEKAGIPVIRLFNNQYSYVGMHRKMMIVDNQHMVAGGMNFGDVYSHKNPDPKIARWRDTDVYVKGAGAVQGNQLFAKIWNDQIKTERYSYLKGTKMNVENPTPDQSNIEISVINNDPTENQEGSTIMLTILKAIREAKSQIDIENAYIILFPGLKQEIQAAAQRGVHVRIFTNSGESVDEPVVSIPILRSVGEFLKMGPNVQVYTKKGATLHSKFIAVDSQFSMIMSYNLHPRSERVEGEMAVAVRGGNFAQTMHDVFTQDVTPDKANELRSLQDLTIPKSAVVVPTLRVFFDML
jgi:cardiolipin synthase